MSGPLTILLMCYGNSCLSQMAEQGIDIPNHYSKPLDDLQDVNSDFVITACGHADETCPVLITNVKKIHFGFDDPPKLTLVSLELAFAELVTGASMNPARSLRPVVASGNFDSLWISIFATPLGAKLAVFTCRLTKGLECCNEESKMENFRE